MIKHLLAAAMAAFAFAANAASTSFTADTSTIIQDNPERAWYLGVQAAEFCSGSLANWRANGSSGAGNQPVTIAKWDINPSTISSGTANTTLGCARSLGVKVIFRLQYCTGGSCNEGRTITQVEADAQAMKTWMYANRDVIMGVLAGMVGAYGEWVGGTAGLDTAANKARVRDALLGAVPPEIPVLFRHPPIIQAWYSTPLGATERFTGSARARAGVYNDCYLTSQGDSSTYPGTVTVVDVNYTGTEATQRAFANKQTDGTMFGGETCDNSSGATNPPAGQVGMRINCSGYTVAGLPGGILAEGPYYHQTFLHRGYATVFYDQWATGGCYNTVTNLMGYRLELGSLVHADTMTRGSSYQTILTMRNYGMARLFSARQAELVFVKAGANDIVCRFGPQLRVLPPMATTTTPLLANCAIPATGQATGSYTGYIRIPDVTHPGLTAPGVLFNIRPANASAGWDGTNHRYATGTTMTVN